MAQDKNINEYYVALFRVVVRDTKALLTDLVVGHKVHYGTQSSDQIGKAGSRKKRWALFPVIGSVFKGLFGVATSADLDEYVDHIKVLTKVAQQHGQLIEHALQAINEQADIIEDIEGRVKWIGDQMVEWLFEMKSLARGAIMFTRAQVLYNQVEVLAGKYHDVLRDIVLASRGMVSPTLLSPLKLREVLEVAKHKWKLEPLVALEMVGQYYSLMTAKLLYNAVIITIPLKSGEFYTMFKLHTFPVKHDDQFVVPDIDTQSLIVVSSGKEFYAFPSSKILDNCITPAEHVFICPPTEFIFFNQAWVNKQSSKKCAVSIIHDQEVNEICQYSPVTVEGITLKHVNHLKYILFPYKLDLLSINCPDQKSSVHSVMGAYVFLETCSVSGDMFKIYAANTHLEVVQLTIPNVSLLEINITLPFQPKMLDSSWNPKVPHKVPTKLETVPFMEWSHQGLFNITMPVLLGLLIVTIIVLVCLRQKWKQAGPSALVNRIRAMFRDHDAQGPGVEE